MPLYESKALTKSKLSISIALCKGEKPSSSWKLGLTPSFIKLLTAIISLFFIATKSSSCFISNSLFSKGSIVGVGLVVSSFFSSNLSSSFSISFGSFLIILSSLFLESSFSLSIFSFPAK